MNEWKEIKYEINISVLHFLKKKTHFDLSITFMITVIKYFSTLKPNLRSLRAAPPGPRFLSAASRRTPGAPRVTLRSPAGPSFAFEEKLLRTRTNSKGTSGEVEREGSVVFLPFFVFQYFLVNYKFFFFFKVLLLYLVVVVVWSWFLGCFCLFF